MSDDPTQQYLQQALFEMSCAGVAAVAMATPESEAVELVDAPTCVRRASVQRQREFFGGRQCARKALAKFGVDAGSIGIGADHLPSWPAGFLGSISHSKGYCAALVGSRSDFCGLGVDLEKTNRLSDQAIMRVLHPDEEAFAAGDQQLASLFFSAKEAFYKMQFPRWRTTANFQDLALGLERSSSAFELRVGWMSNRFSSVLRSRARDVCIRGQFFGDFVVSVCWMEGASGLFGGL